MNIYIFSLILITLENIFFNLNMSFTKSIYLFFFVFLEYQSKSTVSLYIGFVLILNKIEINR